MSDLGSELSVVRTSVVYLTLDTDLRDGGGWAKRRVCIATPDILGPVKNGGIDTAYHHLARLLANRGHEVVIAYVNVNTGSAGLMEETRALCAGFDVAFEPIAPRPASKYSMAQVAASTWALLDWLRACEGSFDIVHVSDWHGLGSGYMRGAKALMRAGRPEEAQALAFEAMERFSEASPGGHVQRGEVLMRRGNDANTGRPLRGPPVRIEGVQVVTSTWR